MTQHYKYSPSASQRQMACTASAQLPPVESAESEAAREGTAAHAVAEQLLRAAVAADPFNPGVDFPEVESPEMLGAALKFVDYCAPIAKTANVHGQEETFTSGRLDGYGGTVDFYAVHDTHLTVVDFKYGAGHPVVAERNTQLLDYAALITEHYPEVQTYTLAIIQPRTAGDAVEEWHCFREDVDKHFADRLAASNRNDYATGRHCLWCPHRPTCDAAYNEALAVAQETFDVRPPADKLDRLVYLFHQAEHVKSYFAAIPGILLGAMQKGHSFPGLKAVKALGHRTWKLGEDETVKALARKKLGKKVAFESRLKTPTQLDREGYGAEIADLVARRDNGFAVVTEADKRPAAVFQTAEETFPDLSFLD